MLVQIQETTKENHKILKSLLHVFEKRPSDIGTNLEPPFSCPKLPVLDEKGLENLELCFSDENNREQMVSSTYLVILLSRPENYI